jgi:hypothetical protein
LEKRHYNHEDVVPLGARIPDLDALGKETPGWIINPEKLKATLEWSFPKNKHEISFLGLCTITGSLFPVFPSLEAAD